MRHYLNPFDFSVDETYRILRLAEKIRKDPARYAHAAEGKKLATLFYEPSTRTRLSFEAAMLNLGGRTLGFPSANVSSVSKGESVADTIRVISCYADIAAMRHPKEGAPFVAARYSGIPLINAGDGGHQHPTQTLTDLLTILSLKGRLDNLTIGLCGDLKFGRTVHSLISAMSRYEGIRFILISPDALKVPPYVIQDVIEPAQIPYEETTDLETALPKLDILYMTRVQRERFASEEEYLRLKDSYILDAEKMKLAPEDMYILHPLPRVNEIAVEVDADPRAKYFYQAQCGVYARMALILTLLGLDGEPLPEKPAEAPRPRLVNSIFCKNPHCITTIEQGLDQVFVLTDPEKEIYRCQYCEAKYDRQ
ncbi:MAG: aspartate carbamoyltransferase [Firmicutes bacterium]|nr:aspartate carbamoyltransferase [Bacillota bacterium]